MVLEIFICSIHALRNLFNRSSFQIPIRKTSSLKRLLKQFSRTPPFVSTSEKFQKDTVSVSEGFH